MLKHMRLRSRLAISLICALSLAIASLGDQKSLSYIEWIKDIQSPLPIRFVVLRQSVEKLNLEETEKLFAEISSTQPVLLQSSEHLITSFPIYYPTQSILADINGAFTSHTCAIITANDFTYFRNLEYWAQDNSQYKTTQLGDLFVLFLCSKELLSIPYFTIGTDSFVHRTERIDQPTKAAQEVYLQVRGSIGKQQLEGLLVAEWQKWRETTGFTFLPRASHVDVFAGINEESLDLGSYIGVLQWDRSRDADAPRISLQGWDGYKEIQKRIVKGSSGIVTSRLDMVISALNEYLLANAQLPLVIDPISGSFKNQRLGIAVDFGNKTNTGGDSILFSWVHEDTTFNEDSSALYEQLLQAGGKHFLDAPAHGRFMEQVSSVCKQADQAMETVGANTRVGSHTTESIINDLRIIFICSITQKDLTFRTVYTLEFSTEKSKKRDQAVPTASIHELSGEAFIGEKVTLDASSSFDPDGRIVSYKWTLPSGEVKESESPVLEIAFKEEGNWLVQLEILDNEGNKAQAEIRVPIQCNLSTSFQRPDNIRANRPTIFSVDKSSCRKGITSIQWDFDGDGIVDAVGSEVTTVYAQPGEYLVSQFVTLDSGEVAKYVDRIIVKPSSEDTDSILNTAPEARILIADSEIYIEDEVVFDASDSRDQDGKIVSYSWIFSDGMRFESQDTTVRRTFANEGEWTVTLQVLDNNGAFASAVANFFVECNLKPPFTSPDEVMEGAQITFQVDPTLCTKAVKSIGWDFDGDGTEDSYGRSVAKAFNTQGEYLVSQIVTTQDGKRTQQIRRITVTPKQFPPNASLSVQSGRLLARTPISFSASESRDPDGVISRYAWDFNGDGVYDKTGVEPVVNWKFSGAGLHTVTVAVTDVQSLTSLASIQVEILPNYNVNSGYLAFSLGMIADMPLYQGAIGLPLNDWLLMGATYGMAKGESRTYGFQLKADIQTLGVNLLIGLNRNWRVGGGLGALVVHQSYQIDAPTLDSPESTRLLPSFSLLAGYQWSFFLVTIELAYVPSIF